IRAKGLSAFAFDWNKNKYKPKIEDGKPMKQYGLTVQLDFKMDQS
ncbi:MAG: hypothetical protein JKY14_00075, partial [Paraglaciecola sp.]|nr:hypothetical protein [Paraglaciecola sp.]